MSRMPADGEQHVVGDDDGRLAVHADQLRRRPVVKSDGLTSVAVEQREAACRKSGKLGAERRLARQKEQAGRAPTK
ncbi:MAG: hypothetical protein U0797_31810 [Gemmataceae bacterium]